MCFFFNDTATTEIYTLSLHDALPISSDPKDVEAGLDDPTPGPNSAETQLDNWLKTRKSQGLGDLASLGLARPKFPPRYRIKFIDYPWSGDTEPGIGTVDFYRRNGFKYVILADTLMDVAHNRRSEKALAPYAAFRDELEGAATERVTFRNPHAATARWLGLEIPGRLDVYVIDEKARH